MDIDIFIYIYIYIQYEVHICFISHTCMFMVQFLHSNPENAHPDSPTSFQGSLSRHKRVHMRSSCGKLMVGLESSSSLPVEYSEYMCWKIGRKPHAAGSIRTGRLRLDFTLTESPLDSLVSLELGGLEWMHLILHNLSSPHKPITL